MANKKKAQSPAAPNSMDQVTDYRFPDSTRKNNPPAKIAAEGFVPLIPKAEYFYSPRRPPELRFDPTGTADELPELLAKATREKLTEAEAWTLAEALRVHEPWLEWAGKREQKSFSVDPVALHIHERVSAQAILKVAAREDVNRSLFADPEQEYNEAVQFYRHDVNWSNRLILGDSLQVMSSLARREDLAGKVQMIYIDPPYGIRFGSNFQPEIGRREVKDKEADLTREPEMVKAYRDTWMLGVHSYLAYLRDRLIAAKDLLTDSGSIFVQIGDDNLHLVTCVLDEVFGPANRLAVITVVKTSAQEDLLLPTVCDYVLWYARNESLVKYHPIWIEKTFEDAGGSEYHRLELPDGKRRLMNATERDSGVLPAGARQYRQDNIVSQRPPGSFPVTFEGKVFTPITGYWKTGVEGFQRLISAGRIEQRGKMLSYVRFLDDFPVRPLANFWADARFSSRAEDKVYVVQTAGTVIERCLLMTTDPGDLVLDPTCGSGTTAYVAEQWGRRWITTDTSRVSLAITRQRLLTARFEYFKLRDDSKGVASGFGSKLVPHVMLRSIARNANLDPIFAKHAPILDAGLAAANAALKRVSEKLRNDLRTKLVLKQRHEGKKAITDADLRRWDLPQQWQHWEVAFDTDPDYPADLTKAVEEYRAAWRAKMDEVNGCIEVNAGQEELVDQPEIDRKITRVSGPFTVEAVQPPEMSLSDGIEVDTGFAGEPDEVEETFALSGKIVVREVQMGESAQNVEAYLSKMVDLLRMDGVRFPDNKHLKFTRLDAIYATGSFSGIHAEGRWVNAGESDGDPEGSATVGVVFGPQYGPITAKMIEEVIKPAARRYDDLVFAGFSFDGPAQAVIDEGVLRLRLHLAHIRPDVNPGMNGLLKEQPGSQLFTVFGRPRTKLNPPDADGMFTLKMEGVDIYDPVTNNVTDTGASKVAAWFLDSDYDGRTFCITQAFFPDRGAWEKLSKALNGVVDPERFEALSGTVSLPFAAGKHKSAAVKVIDPRGNEVMRVHALGGSGK
jgi:adenine-specific DNA-methyltransferase